MKLKLILSFCIIINMLPAFAQNEMTQEHQQTVSDFISYIKNNNRDSVAARVFFPFKRQYPIPVINNKQEFLRRYDEVFDAKLIDMISNSNPDKDWSAVGYRGMMLFSGDVWLDYDGILVGVNYQSAYEVKEMHRLIAADKAGLYKPLRNFKQPVCILQTRAYVVRVDQMNDNSYRYASWKKGSSMAAKPDVVVLKGEFVPQGSGGNHSYVFKNGAYTYECEIIIIGEDNAPPAYLTVYKSGKKIQSAEAGVAP